MHPKVKELAMQMFSDKDDETRNERLEFQRRIRALEKENKKLNEDNTKYIEQFVELSGTCDGLWVDGLQEQVKKLKEENEKLKKEIQGIPALLEEERYKERACNERDDAEKFEELKEENEELEEQIKTLENIHNGDMKIVKMLKEKWNEEQEEIKKLKKVCRDLRQWHLSDDMIDDISAENIDEFERDVRDNWDELNGVGSFSGPPTSQVLEKKLKAAETKVEELKDYQSEVDNMENGLVNDYPEISEEWRYYEIPDIIKKLKEENKKLKAFKSEVIDAMKYDDDADDDDIISSISGMEEDIVGECELQEQIRDLKEENEELKEEKDVSVRRIEYYEKYIDEHIDTQEWVNFVEKYSKTDGIVLFGFEGDEESESEEEEECHTDDWNNPCPICKDIMGGIVCNTFGQESCGGCAIKIMKEKQKN
jgi:DNA repair exonuclease SbcCD ATPase subunit